jgi:hypothetical protein
MEIVVKPHAIHGGESEFRTITDQSSSRINRWLSMHIAHSSALEIVLETAQFQALSQSFST